MPNFKLSQLNKSQSEILTERETLHIAGGGFSLGLDFGSQEARSSADSSYSQDRSGNTRSIINASNDTISNVDTGGGNFFADPESISIG